jgi:glutaredoxin
VVVWAGVQWIGSDRTDRLGRDVARLAKPGDIVMVSSQTCPYCRMARSWFQAYGIPYSECLIEQDATCAATYDKLQRPGTPVLLVRGQRQDGFSAERIARAFNAG